MSRALRDVRVLLLFQRTGTGSVIFMELAFQSNQKKDWDSLWTAVTKGNKKYTIPSTLTDLFGAGFEPVIYIMRSRDPDTQKIMYDSQVKDIMGQIKKGILSPRAVSQGCRKDCVFFGVKPDVFDSAFECVDI